ncbi:hypothetical protein RchiOBHm_Chr3g0471561 [Rosa chinensis]|uniref:B box-type domain-containing protein n=1 Tax=Rosa chinensis TaxID=74649 RepID=A0A2P6RBD8_ROSCH|nr:hypothetical protein RchiOBHm_Chr3g0471561 [Rosa chinensis]
MLVDQRSQFWRRFFCLEDRALLCRKCDVAIIPHCEWFCFQSPEVLLTRIKVGPKPDQTGSDGGGGGVAGSSSSVKSDSRAVSKCEANIQLAEECKVSLSSVAGMSFAGGSAAGSVPQWPMDEFMGFTYFDQSIGYMDNGSSKVCAHWLQCETDYTLDSNFVLR